MKKTTKPNAGVGKKPQAKASIQNFFKVTAKSVPIDKPESNVPDGTTQAVYVELLKAKLQEETVAASDGANRKCIQSEEELPGATAVMELQDVESPLVAPNLCDVCKATIKCAEAVDTVECSRCKDFAAKYKNLKKEYMQMGTDFAQLQMKYNRLNAEANIETGQPSNEISNENGIFTSIEIEVLQTMKLDAESDSGFILNCLKFAYKNDVSVLRMKTLKGTPEAFTVSVSGEVTRKPAKDPLTPSKVKAIRELFVQRIKKCKLKPAAFNERIKEAHMNKLVASGITNLGRKA